MDAFRERTGAGGGGLGGRSGGLFKSAEGAGLKKQFHELQL